MGHEITWEANGRGATQRYFGEVTASDLRAATNRVHSCPSFDDLRWLIKDYSEAKKLSFSQTELEEIVSHYVGAFISNPRLKVAFVVTNEEFLPVLNIAVATIKGVDLKKDRVIVSSSREEALNWVKGGS